MFVCLGFFIPLENFSLIWRRHYYRRRAANFDLCWLLIKQWRFFLRATPTVTRNIRGHIYCPYGSGAVTTCFNDRGLSRMGFDLTFRLRDERYNRLRHRRNEWIFININMYKMSKKKPQPTAWDYMLFFFHLRMNKQKDLHYIFFNWRIS